jgi:DNA-binding XRE family transcriptional regulator
MLLHEAVLKARKDLGLSQKRLAELAGVQRKQLATLEKGGNITLSTLRKVLSHLPNLESFTIDAVKASVQRDVPLDEAVEKVQLGVRQLGQALKGMFAKLEAGQALDEDDLAALGEASNNFKRGYGWTEEDIRREREEEDRQIDAEIAQYRRGVEEGFRAMAEMNSRRLKRARLALRAARESAR